MHFSNFFALGAFALSASATRTPPPGQGPELKPWKATDLEWVYSPGGTSESFHVSSKAQYGMPAFSVGCYATSYDKTYRKCHGDVAKGAKVSHFWQYTDGDRANFYIKYEAEGKTLMAVRLVEFGAPGESQHFKAYPAVQWNDVAEDETELVEDEDE